MPNRVKVGDSFMVEILLSPDTAARVHHFAQIQEREPESKLLPPHCVMRGDIRDRWAKNGVARLRFRSKGWMPMPGGFFFCVHKAIGRGRRNRSIAFYVDQEWSNKLIEQNETRFRGSLILQEVEGRWYAYVRFNDAKGRTYKQLKEDKEKRLRKAALSTDGDNPSPTGDITPN
jgi:hypothetical protein